MFVDPDKGTKQKINFKTWEFGAPFEWAEKTEKRIKRALAKAILSDDFLSFSSSIIEDYMRDVLTYALRNTIGLGGPDLEPENCVTADILSGTDRIEIELPFGVDGDSPTWSFTLRELVENQLDDYRLANGNLTFDQEEADRLKLTAAELRATTEWLEQQIATARIEP